MSQLKILADQNQVNGWKRMFCKRIGKHLRDSVGNPTLMTNDKLFELSASVKSSVIGKKYLLYMYVLLIIWFQ